VSVAPEAPPPSRHLPHWPVVAAIVVALLVAAGVGAAVALVLDNDSSSSSGPPAACRAVKVARETLPSVVTIEVQAAGGGGSGSGEVLRRGGEVLTNDHVVSSAATSGSINVIFSDGETAPATILGRDPATDLAVIKVRSERSLRPIPLGESSKLAVGEPVVALGAPLGLSSSVTTGIVSALGRSVQLPTGGAQPALLVGAIQTDAAINPGNSGGALVDCAGKLVGVPTAGAVVPGPNGPTPGSIGIGFAIPSEFAKAISDELISNGSVTHSSFGQVSQIPAAVAGSAGESGGLYVVAVTPGGPSDAAGLRAGDIITKVDGEALSSAQQLQAVTLTKRPGENVTIVYRRNGTEHSATVTLGRLSPTP
jgi:putative serine protease PepD